MKLKYSKLKVGDKVRIKSWKSKLLSKKIYTIHDMYTAYNNTLQVQFLNHSTCPAYLIVKVNSEVIKKRLGIG